MDVPASSFNASVNTASVNDLHIGSGFDGTNPMSGSLDEFRITNQVRGQAWAAYEYQNQKSGGNLLKYDLDYQTAPVLPNDLNLTIVQGIDFSFQVKSNPPAFSYSIVSGSLPSGVNLNSFGVITGNTNDAVSSLNLVLSATNSKGQARLT